MGDTPEQDPIDELSRLLKKESLEDRFQKLLVSVFRRICDGGYYPAADLLGVIETRGAVAFANDWLNDDRAQPFFDLMVELGRFDLTVESSIVRPPYCELFGADGLNAFNRRAGSVGSDGARFLFHKVRTYWPKKYDNPSDYAEAAVRNLAEDRSYTTFDLRALQRRRAADWASLSMNHRCENLEKELREGYPFTSTSELIKYVQERPELKHEHQLLQSSVNGMRESVPKTLEPFLQLLRPGLDLSDEKITVVATRLKLPTSEAVHWLEFRAAQLSANLGNKIYDVAEIFFGCTREQPFPPMLGSHFGPEDSELLEIALVLSTLLPLGTLIDAPVHSFDDLPETPHAWVWPIGQIEGLSEEMDDEQLAPWYGDVKVEAVVAFVIFHLRNRQALGPGAERGALSTMPSRASDRSSGESDIIYELMFKTGPDRRQRAEQALRERLGGLFDELCPEAKAALIGAEFTLADGWHPEPSQALLSIAVAFERQLHAGFLNQLAEFANASHRNPFPTNANNERIALVQNGQPLGGRTLGQVLKALRVQDTLWADFAAEHGFKMDDVRKAVGEVQRLRNRAAHEGGLSPEVVRQCRESWLDPQHGIFRALSGPVTD
jgi:hypothetical protein